MGYSVDKRRVASSLILLSNARAQVLAQVVGSQSGALAKAPGLAALGFRTSMRNQLPCTVTALKSQGQAYGLSLLYPMASH